MRTCYDAITPTNIPTTAQIVCGYIDGRYAWTAASWARFPHAVKVRIAVFSSTNDGHVLDVEPGCSTPASAPGWVVRRRAAGVDPTIYCNEATWPTVKAAFHNAGVTEPHYWIAGYPGSHAGLYPGSIAHQYADPPKSGGGYDVSVVADYWPGVDARPTSQAADVIPTIFTNPPAPTPEVDMPITDADAAKIVHALLVTNLGRSGPNIAVALQTAAGGVDLPKLAALIAAAIPTAAVTQAQLEAALRTVLGSVDGTP